MIRLLLVMMLSLPFTAFAVEGCAYTQCTGQVKRLVRDSTDIRLSVLPNEIVVPQLQRDERLSYISPTVRKAIQPLSAFSHNMLFVLFVGVSMVLVGSLVGVKTLYTYDDGHTDFKQVSYRNASVLFILGCSMVSAAFLSAV
jgi:hypothetical protein